MMTLLAAERVRRFIETVEIVSPALATVNSELPPQQMGHRVSSDR